MNEGRTTAIFAAIAVAGLILAWVSKPEAISEESDLKKEIEGQPVFAKFEDPSAAASLQIVKYDEDLGQLERFEVATDKATNMWKLPSYDDYPADAAEQVRDATTPLISMPVLNVVSLDRGDHSLYGVVNPDEEGLSVGESGVGMLVRVKDKADELLAELIVGKPVDGTENQRYVRVPTEDAVYVVQLDTNPFTTEFQTWINDELLGVRSFDISSIGIRDYAIVPTQNGYGMSRNFDADLAFDASASKWSLERLVNYESGQANEASLADGEELNATSLNNLRNAVQDLQIVSVRRKPTGLAADLKADKSLMENQESLQSLVSQGFIPQESAGGTEIFATGGETLIGTQDGVKYLMRFGEAVANLTEQTDSDEESGLRRYLLVSAVLDEDKFPAPDLEPLPETVDELLARDQQAAEEASGGGATEGNDASQNGSAESDAEGERPPSPARQPASGGDNSASGATATGDQAESEGEENESANGAAAVVEVEAASEEPSGNETDESDSTDDSDVDQDLSDQDLSDQETGDDADATAPSDASTAAEEAASSDAPAEAEAGAEGDQDTIEEGEPAAPEETAEELQERLEFTREQIAKENQRKIDERNEKLDQARKRVQELNARFADWYYVVSDSVYKKLKISKSELIQKEGATDDAGELSPAGLPQGIPGLPQGFGGQFPE